MAGAASPLTAPTAPAPPPPPADAAKLELTRRVRWPPPLELLVLWSRSWVESTSSAAMPRSGTAGGADVGPDSLMGNAGALSARNGTPMRGRCPLLDRACGFAAAVEVCSSAVAPAVTRALWRCWRCVWRRRSTDCRVSSATWEEVGTGHASTDTKQARCVSGSARSNTWHDRISCSTSVGRRAEAVSATTTPTHAHAHTHTCTLAGTHLHLFRPCQQRMTAASSTFACVPSPHTTRRQVKLRAHTAAPAPHATTYLRRRSVPICRGVFADTDEAKAAGGTYDDSEVGVP